MRKFILPSIRLAATLAKKGAARGALDFITDARLERPHPLADDVRAIRASLIHVRCYLIGAMCLLALIVIKLWVH